MLLGKNGLSTRAAVKETNGVESLRTVKEYVTQNRLRCFKEGDNSLGDESRSKRPFVVEDEVMFEIVEQQPIISTRTLSADLVHSKNLLRCF